MGPLSIHRPNDEQHRWYLAAAFAAIVTAIAVPAAAERRQIDTDRSSITVRVFKAGVFRAFADNHEIQAAIARGFVDEGVDGGVQMVVDANRLRVLDPNLSARDRDQVQTRMFGTEVLDVSRFPEIRFQSTTIERIQSDIWNARGQLTLHGQTRPVTVKVAHENGHYRGSVSLKQTDFGITPIAIAGGTVKVKDEVTIDFDIVTRLNSRTEQ